MSFLDEKCPHCGAEIAGGTLSDLVTDGALREDGDTEEIECASCDETVVVRYIVPSPTFEVEPLFAVREEGDR